MKDLTVLQAKRYGTISCATQDSLLVAARKMVQEDVSGLVVIDEVGGLVGVITRTDLLRARMQAKNWQELLVESYMSSEVVTVTTKASLQEVARLLIEKQIHRVIIIEISEGKQLPVGVISDADLVYHMTRERSRIKT